MRDLTELRQEIDKLDRKLLPLFLERMEVCREVAEYKKSVGMPVLDTAREKQVLESKLELLENRDMEREVYEFFNSIMAISRGRQSLELAKSGRKMAVNQLTENSKDKIAKPKVCCFGSEGAYSREAAIKYFGKDTDSFYVNDFEAAFDSLSKNKADYTVLPIENSSTGAIEGIMDLLDKYGYYIVGEVYVPIKHCLMAVKGTKLEDIRKVYSHQQGIMQSKEFLKTLGNVECEAYYSTALSAKAVAESGDKTKAAIAGRQSAEIYGLEILAENINSSASNTTRFIVVGKNLEINDSCDKISVAFTLPHESGSLHHLLAAFASGGLNLLSLESRPIPDKPFEYKFFADYAGNLLDTHVQRITDSVIEGSVSFKLIGNYKSGRLEG